MMKIKLIMLSEHRILQLPNLQGGNVEIDVNFSNNEKVKDSQVLRFRFGGQEVDIKRDDLVKVILSLGKDEQIESLIPIKRNKVKEIERKLTFEFVASQDYAKGEKVQIMAPWIDTQAVSTDSYLGSNSS